MNVHRPLIERDMKEDKTIGLVADVGGTNTRLAVVGPKGVQTDTIGRRANANFDSFDNLILDYLATQPVQGRLVVAIAGPVGGRQARLTNRNWVIDADALAHTCGVQNVTLMNDLEALGQAVPTIAPEAVDALHSKTTLGQAGQGLVIGLGTGFNVSMVDTRSGTVMISEQGHASLPSSVMDILSAQLPGTSLFSTVEHLFSGVGLLRLAEVIGVQVDRAEDLVNSDDPRALDAIDVLTDALGQMVRELAFSFFPTAGIYFNGSLAQVLLSPERRARVLAPLRNETGFDGQFARIPAFLFISDTVALGGAAARLLAEDAAQRD